MRSHRTARVAGYLAIRYAVFTVLLYLVCSRSGTSFAANLWSGCEIGTGRLGLNVAPYRYFNLITSRGKTGNRPGLKCPCDTHAE